MTADEQREQHEFLLSQYLDGNLDAEGTRNLEKRLAEDAELAALLDGLRQTDRLVKLSAGPVPNLDWERFARQAAWRREAYDLMQRRRRLVRLFVPLAAAAAIVFMATLYFTGPDGQQAGPTSVVTINRGDQRPGAANLGPAFAEVSVVRLPALEVVSPTAQPRTTAAVAAVGSDRDTTSYEETTPYF
jgi:anti-sigma factor RsiW